MGLTKLFADVTLSENDHIKSQFAFASFYSGYGFFGGLAALSTDTMYAIKTANSSPLRVTGDAVAFPKMIDIVTGWNYLPCPYQTTKPIASGMPDFNFANTDQVKSQFQFAEYYASYGWYGTLSTIEPGKGYKAKTANSGPATFSA